MNRFALAAALSLAAAVSLAPALSLTAAAAIVQTAKAVRFIDWKVVWIYELRPWVEWDGKDAPPAVGKGWRSTPSQELESLRSHADFQLLIARLEANEW